MYKLKDKNMDWIDQVFLQFTDLVLGQGGRKQIFYGGARLNKKNEIMKILQILEIFTK